VLEHLWAQGPADAKAVHRALGRSRGITLNTVQSTLKRLYEKGLLEREKISHAHVYTARRTRGEQHRADLEGLVGALFEAQADLAVAAFVDWTERAGPEHLARLEALVAQRRKGQGQR
jgi:predicted transcriptional regulator